jgi:hypothetical protein
MKDIKAGKENCTFKTHIDLLFKVILDLKGFFHLQKLPKRWKRPQLSVV